MGLNKYDREKILHDIKRLSKGIKLVSEENDAEKRMYIAGLVADEMDRLHSDIEEMTEKGE